MTNEQMVKHFCARIAQHRAEYEGRDRALAAMHIEDGLSQAEIARRTGVKEGTVRIAVKAYGPVLRAELARRDSDGPPRLAQAG